MLNFESVGNPIAKIIDKKNTKKEQIVYLSDPELDGEVRNGYTNIDLEPHQSFQQITSNKERDILYITGASGSGKSYYSAEYIKQYIKKHPKNEVMLFSSVGDDAVLDKIKKVKRFKIHDGDFVGEQFSIADFKDSLLIFDDVDCISSKPILKKVYEILDKALTTGRHTGTSVIYTTHTACNGKATKLILTESHSVTFFISGMGGKSSRYLLDSYLGLDKKQIERFKNIKSRWTTIMKTYPQLVLTQRKLTFSKDL
jgi:hypothetical protein